jgi:quinol-cytochrome oxidoreductase complex cytochrome b subunit
VLWVLTLQVVALVVTGAVLYFAYVPTATQAFGAGFPDAEGGEVAEVVRLVHRWASWFAVPTSLLAASLLSLRSRPSERVVSGLALGAGLVLAIMAASFTGYLLPWDQLALYAVTVGRNLSGYTWLGNDDVRFALMDGTEIAPRTVAKWLVLHAVLLGGAAAALVAVAWRRTRAGAAAEGHDDTPAVEVPAGV